jgi:hypothetical protein
LNIETTGTLNIRYLIYYNSQLRVKFLSVRALTNLIKNYIGILSKSDIFSIWWNSDRRAVIVGVFGTAWQRAPEQ